MWDFSTVAGAGRRRWTWTRYAGGRMLASSGGRFAGLTEALADAKRHGFVACSDRWDVTTGPGTLGAPREK